MNPLTLEQTLQALIQATLVDATTLKAITATNTGLTSASDTPAVASVDARGNLVGLTPGSGNLSTTATWTYTDPILSSK